MAELKEPAQGLWTGYGSPATMSNGRFGHSGAALDSVLDNAAGPAPSASIPHSARPRTDATGYPYTPRYPQDDNDVYGRHHSTSGTAVVPDPSQAAHTSYPGLKRTYSQSEQQHQQHQHQHQQYQQQPPPPAPRMPLYATMPTELREKGVVKISSDQDQKMLCFQRIPDRHTIVDRHGHVQHLDLAAQLHGMFFLSESPLCASDGTVLKPELTCYRRNLFQISGRLIIPRGQLSVVGDGGETTAINSTELTITAAEAVDAHPIRLIVIPWKTPPPNSSDVVQKPDQEPAPLPLIPFQDDGSKVDGDYAVYPIGWRRLQFRIATANNGRRKELQQHFVLNLKAIATLTNGSKIVLAESTTAKIVVRGRSPRNFEPRKEISLLGSSAGSRGQALVETGMGILAGPLTAKTQEKARVMAMDLPRSSFNYATASKVPPSPVSVRSNSYPAWKSSQMPVPTTGAEYPATPMNNEPYQKSPASGSPHYTTEPQEMPMQPSSSTASTQLPLLANDHPQPSVRTPYAYVQGPSAPPSQMSLPTAGDASSLSIPRYIDDSARPTKSARLSNQDSVHSTPSLGISSDPPSEYRYGPSPYLSAGASSDIGPHSHTHTHSHPHPHQNPHPHQPTHPHQHFGGHHSPSLPPTQQGRPLQHSQLQAQQRSPLQSLPLPSPLQHQQQQQVQSAYNAVSHDTSGPNGASNSSSVTPAVHPPPRDYYPPTSPWAHPPGDSNQGSYSNGEPRHYSFPDQYKSGHQIKSEPLPQPLGYAASRSSFDSTTMNNYSWSAA